MARTLHRSPTRVKPVATSSHTLDLDDGDHRTAQSGRVGRKLCHTHFPNPRLFPVHQDSPHKWTVRHTFKWEFDLPTPTNPFYEPTPKPKARRHANHRQHNLRSAAPPSLRPLGPNNQGLPRKPNGHASRQRNAKHAPGHAPLKRAGTSRPPTCPSTGEGKLPDA